MVDTKPPHPPSGADVRGREVHSRLRLAVLAAAVAAAFAPAAHAAVRPITWCGDAASASDRPDVVGGDQIHVVYAVPGDSADRFAQVASAIATDVGAIGEWW